MLDILSQRKEPNIGAYLKQHEQTGSGEKLRQLFGLDKAEKILLTRNLILCSKKIKVKFFLTEKHVAWFPYLFQDHMKRWFVPMFLFFAHP